MGLKSACSSVTKSCLTLCHPMDCSTPGFPVLRCLPELAQTHVHWVGDVIQPSYPMSSPSPPTFNLSQHQGLIWHQSVPSTMFILPLLESGTLCLLVLRDLDQRWRLCNFRNWGRKIFPRVPLHLPLYLVTLLNPSGLWISRVNMLDWLCLVTRFKVTGDVPVWLALWTLGEWPT